MQKGSVSHSERSSTFITALPQSQQDGILLSISTYIDREHVVYTYSGILSYV